MLIVITEVHRGELRTLCDCLGCPERLTESDPVKTSKTHRNKTSRNFVADQMVNCEACSLALKPAGLQGCYLFALKRLLWWSGVTNSLCLPKTCWWNFTICQGDQFAKISTCVCGKLCKDHALLLPCKLWRWSLRCEQLFHQEIRGGPQSEYPVWHHRGASMMAGMMPTCGIVHLGSHVNFT